MSVFHISLTYGSEKYETQKTFISQYYLARNACAEMTVKSGILEIARATA
jgi:hypothetical protein